MSTIAIDLDDVLCNTNETVAIMHNEMYGTDMTLDDFKHYLYWKNRGWGTVQDTVEKVKAIYDAGLFSRVQPVPGAKEGCEALVSLGYKLIIVTARSEIRRSETEEWIGRYMPVELFDGIWFTGGTSALGAHLTGQVAIHTAQTKAEVMQQTSCTILIDDSLENSVDVISTLPDSATVLLFGLYPWNLRNSRAYTEEDLLCYEERVARGLEDDVYGQVPEGVERVETWGEVVDFLRWRS